MGDEDALVRRGEAELLQVTGPLQIRSDRGRDVDATLAQPTRHSFGIRAPS